MMTIDPVKLEDGWLKWPDVHIQIKEIACYLVANDECWIYTKGGAAFQVNSNIETIEVLIKQNKKR